MSSKASKKTVFKPINRHKYKGNPNNIMARSSYELRVMKVFDLQENVLWWNSENVAIPYRDPSRRGVRRKYYPDFLVCVRTKNGGTKTLLVEVKPYRETQKPREQKRRTKRYLLEASTYSTNTAKWEAARRYCDARGWSFVIWSEKDLWKKNG